MLFLIFVKKPKKDIVSDVFLIYYSTKCFRDIIKKIPEKVCIRKCMCFLLTEVFAFLNCGLDDISCVLKFESDAKANVLFTNFLRKFY